jgi:hypothetical protein
MNIASTGDLSAAQEYAASYGLDLRSLDFNPAALRADAERCPASTFVFYAGRASNRCVAVAKQTMLSGCTVCAGDALGREALLAMRAGAPQASAPPPWTSRSSTQRASCPRWRPRSPRRTASRLTSSGGPTGSSTATAPARTRARRRWRRRCSSRSTARRGARRRACSSSTCSR